MTESCWQQGSKAAIAGLIPDDCPYQVTNYDWVTWMNGWIVTYHRLAKEELIKSTN